MLFVFPFGLNENAGAGETVDGPGFQHDDGGKRSANAGHRGQQGVVGMWRDFLPKTPFHDIDLFAERRDDRDVRLNRERHVVWQVQLVDSRRVQMLDLIARDSPAFPSRTCA